MVGPTIHLLYASRPLLLPTSFINKVPNFKRTPLKSFPPHQPAINYCPPPPRAHSSPMEAITALLLFSLLLCALFNSLFFHPSKLLPWLRSAFLSAIFSPPKLTTTAPDTSEVKRMEDEDLRTVFATFDSDGDGFISEGELAESLRRLGLAVSESEVRSVMEKADSNSDGLIDFAEFKELCSSWRPENYGGEEAEAEKELREAFAVFDGDGDGVITVEELRLVLKSLGLKQGEAAEACRNMIRKVDMDGDGMVNFEEFKTMMEVREGNLF